MAFRASAHKGLICLPISDLRIYVVSKSGGTTAQNGRLPLSRRTGRQELRRGGGIAHAVGCASVRIESGERRLSLSGRRWGAECGERVVTGGKIGLQANGGNDRDKKIARAALVTAW